jgi:hypothetical protein
VQRNRAGEQKFYKLFGLYSLVLLLSSSITLLNAETFADFKRTQSASFKEYKDEKDKAFNRYLKSEWEAYIAQKPLSLYEDPKPKTISPKKATKIKSVGPRITIRVKPLSEKVVTKKEPAKKAEKFESKDINFDFFGSTVGFNVPSEIKNAKFYPQAQEGISNFFNTVVATDYSYLIEDIDNTSKSMNLNDWGVYLLVTKLSHQLFSSQDESKLFSWIVFNKLGYSVRVGLANRNIVLMFNSDKVIYAAPNYTINNKKFYVLSNESKAKIGRIYTYKNNYPDSDKPLDLSLTTLPNFKEDIATKTLAYKELGKEYKVSYEYNKNLIDFMATYPQADYETYFNAPLEPKSYEMIAMDLKKYIDDKKASEAINFVLNFVQNAFKYETDFEQFGHEKVMFAEETLYYDKSDCEDRAVLFAYLVKKLFRVGVIGVKYKDHMATALYIPMDGDSVKFNSKKFVIADPTYINANIGQSMPKYRAIKPESFIVVNIAKKRL